MEIWKDIPDYEGHYQASTLGRIKSIKFSNHRILKQNPNNKGRMKVTLYKDRKQQCIQVHQLVAMTFLKHKRCGFKLIVDHINNDYLDNRVENLQLTTVRHNTSKDRRGGSSEYVGVHWNKSAMKWVALIRIKGINTHLGCFDCEVEASKAYQKKLAEIE